MTKYSKLSREQRQQRVVDYLRGHQDATLRDTRKAGLEHLLENTYRSIDEARIAAGLITDEHISAAEAARRLGVNRSYVSRLFREGRLSGRRLGRKVFIHISNIEKIKQRRIA